METTKRRGFVQRVLCFFGGAVGAAALPPSTSAETVASADVPEAGTIRLHLRCRHKHRAEQPGGRIICGGEIFDRADGNIVGQFYANCFQAESALGAVNPHAAANVEMHTIRLADGVLFGMGANGPKNESVKSHAIVGGTGRYAGARGTYTIAETGAPHTGAQLTIQLLS